MTRGVEVSPFSVPVRYYADLDHYRRALARLSETLGYATESCPYELIATETLAAVQQYVACDNKGPVVLLVPAPIKTADIWDLAPAVSVVRRHLEYGCRVYLIRWPRITENEASLGINDYAGAMLRAAMTIVHEQTAEKRVFLTGHSIGGIFATLFAARYPEEVQGLTLLGTPLHFSHDIGAFDRLVAMFPHTRPLTADAGAVPGSLLSSISAASSPQTFVLSRCADWFASLTDPPGMYLHQLVERWTLDEAALPQRLFEDLVEDLYRRDAFFNGRLRIDQRRVSPRDVKAPVACVVDRHCHIAPPKSILPVLEHLGTGDQQLFWYPGETGVSLQHAGLLVGRRSHHEVWPELLAWLSARYGARAAATAGV